MRSSIVRTTIAFATGSNGADADPPVPASCSAKKRQCQVQRSFCRRRTWNSVNTLASSPATRNRQHGGCVLAGSLAQGAGRPAGCRH